MRESAVITPRYSIAPILRYTSTAVLLAAGVSLAVWLEQEELPAQTENAPADERVKDRHGFLPGWSRPDEVHQAQLYREKLRELGRRLLAREVTLEEASEQLLKVIEELHPKLLSILKRDYPDADQDHLVGLVLVDYLRMPRRRFPLTPEEREVAEELLHEYLSWDLPPSIRRFFMPKP